MNFVMAGAEKKRFGVFIQTMRRFDEYAETFFKKPEAFFQVLRQYTFDALATCGRWGSNVRSLEPDRAVNFFCIVRMIYTRRCRRVLQARLLRSSGEEAIY